MTDWARGYGAGKQSQQGEIQWHRAEVERLQAHQRAQAEDIMTLGQEVGRLLAALQQYGDHTYECSMKEDNTCNCGYSAALETEAAAEIERLRADNAQTLEELRKMRVENHCLRADNTAMRAALAEPVTTP